MPFRQELVFKPAKYKAIAQRARQAQYDTEDELTSAIIHTAKQAAERAKRTRMEAEQFLSDTA